MKLELVSGLMLTLLLIGMSTLAFNIEQVSAIESPYIAVIPDTIVDPTLTPGKNFTVSIYTDYTGSDIWGWQFTLAYNSSIIHGVEVINGDLITNDTFTHLPPWMRPARFIQGVFDNTLGTLSLTVAFYFFLLPLPPTTPGPGILANVTFEVVGLGRTNITLGADTALKTPTYDIIDGELMPDHLRHGYFSNIDGLPPPAITATVNIKPNTLNLKSKGKWITCYIELSEGYDVSDIDVSTVMLNDTIPISLLDVPAPEPVPTEIGDYDSDGVPDLMVKFNRAALTSHIYHVSGITYGNVALTITGQLADGTMFEGSDTIKVMFGGDADLSGFVELADFPIWANNVGKYSGEWSFDVNPDFDSNDFVELADFLIWSENFGATVPPPP